MKTGDLCGFIHPESNPDTVREILDHSAHELVGGSLYPECGTDQGSGSGHCLPPTTQLLEPCSTVWV
jgi:hypothetical protein